MLSVKVEPERGPFIRLPRSLFEELARRDDPIAPELVEVRFTTPGGREGVGYVPVGGMTVIYKRRILTGATEWDVTDHKFAGATLTGLATYYTTMGELEGRIQAALEAIREGLRPSALQELRDFVENFASEVMTKYVLEVADDATVEAVGKVFDAMRREQAKAVKAIKDSKEVRRGVFMPLYETIIGSESYECMGTPVNKELLASPTTFTCIPKGEERPRTVIVYGNLADIFEGNWPVYNVSFFSGVAKPPYRNADVVVRLGGPSGRDITSELITETVNPEYRGWAYDELMKGDMYVELLPFGHAALSTTASFFEGLHRVKLSAFDVAAGRLRFRVAGFDYRVVQWWADPKSRTYRELKCFKPLPGDFKALAPPLVGTVLRGPDKGANMGMPVVVPAAEGYHNMLMPLSYYSCYDFEQLRFEVDARTTKEIDYDASLLGRVVPSEDLEENLRKGVLPSDPRQAVRTYEVESHLPVVGYELAPVDEEILKELALPEFCDIHEDGMLYMF